MKATADKVNFKKSESGQMTLGFLFATVLLIGTAMLISALTMAFTFTEVIQYISFSGSRAYLSADVDVQTQQQAAQAQVLNLLKKLPFISGARENGWILVQPQGANDYKNYATARGANPDPRNQFLGYQLIVALPLLTFKIPLLSAAVTPPADEENVTVTISSFLGREPTQQECEAFNNGAYQALLQKPAYQQATGRVSAESYEAVNDNGC
ncbi:MAG: hypothetical protein IPM57_03465 [Oligoflexia bacterium]|nr:hypothetical protein [Oligoflexia bacterium]